MQLPVKLALAVLLLGVAAFCGFGFLASFEAISNPLPWRLGYGAAVLAALAGAGALVWSAKSTKQGR